MAVAVSLGLDSSSWLDSSAGVEVSSAGDSLESPVGDEVSSGSAGEEVSDGE